MVSESYGIFDTFSNAAGRNAHVDGEIPKALAANTDKLLGAAQKMAFADIIAHKLTPFATGLTVGQPVLLKEKAGMAATLKDALAARTRAVKAEEILPFWYVFQEGANDFGAVAVFKSAEDRTEHLLNVDALALKAKSKDLLEGEADISLFTVLAYKI
ncbi:hypothetical protein FA95DRAFT_1573821 [Auriscalpium vulgare]|uniref:Uncharacterized protein n=1 Tax=Auriscalpium vulgare TaxID=40419 RepID=A0ACB8RP51_9AGAM|nr:hypothetical protein FA95DRAFT_1573821 [Auriscalpium vulgare]